MAMEGGWAVRACDYCGEERLTKPLGDGTYSCQACLHLGQRAAREAVKGPLRPFALITLLALGVILVIAGIALLLGGLMLMLFIPFIFPFFFGWRWSRRQRKGRQKKKRLWEDLR